MNQCQSYKELRVCILCVHSNGVKQIFIFIIHTANCVCLLAAGWITSAIDKHIRTHKTVVFIYIYIRFWLSCCLCYCHCRDHLFNDNHILILPFLSSCFYLYQHRIHFHSGKIPFSFVRLILICCSFFFSSLFIQSIYKYLCASCIYDVHTANGDNDENEKRERKKSLNSLLQTFFSFFIIHFFALMLFIFSKCICQLRSESCQMSPHRCAIFCSYFCIPFMYRLFFFAFCVCVVYMCLYIISKTHTQHTMYTLFNAFNAIYRHNTQTHTHKRTLNSAKSTNKYICTTMMTILVDHMSILCSMCVLTCV